MQENASAKANSDSLGAAWHGDELSPITASLFNGAIASAAIAALFELDFFEELDQAGAIEIEKFCSQRDLQLSSIKSLLYALQCFHIVDVSADGKKVRPGNAFVETFKDKGYFLWLVKGYGHLWRNLSELVHVGQGTVESVGRDGKSIAMAGRDYGAQFVDRYFTEMLHKEPVTMAADLGCGSADRLIKLAQQQAEFRGIGIDMNEGAVMLAQQLVRATGLEDRITIVHGDASWLDARPEFKEVDVLFSFFMGHDLWPRKNCLQSFKRIREVFPNLKRFLLSDTYRSDLPPSPDVPIFTLGFEVTHAVMGQYIPSISEWMSLFEEAGWLCVARQDIGIPYSSIFDLRPNRA